MAASEPSTNGVRPTPTPSYPPQLQDEQSSTLNAALGRRLSNQSPTQGHYGPGHSLSTPHSEDDPVFAPPSSTSDASGTTKSRKRLKTEDDRDVKPKKTRQTQSCDACRARKVKCDRPPPGSATAGDLPTKDVCSHCRQLGMACTFDYKPKKRGPPNMYLKRMQALNQASGLDASNRPPSPGAVVSEYSAEPAALLHKSLDGGQDDLGLNVAGPGTLAKQNALQRSALTVQGMGGGSPIRRGRDAVDDWGPALARAVTAYQRNQPGQPHQQAGNSFGLSSSFMHPSTSGTERSLPSYYSPPQPSSVPPPSSVLSTAAFGGSLGSGPVNPFDVVLPRSLLYHIIDLYFDYVYCLVPCLHKPSFMHDLHARREEQPNQEEWIALVFAVVIVTLAQMPRSFIQLPKREVRSLFNNASALVKEYMDKEFTQLSVYRLIILYFQAIAAHDTSKTYAGHVALGQAYVLSIKMRLHEESSYANLNPVERELRKRMFWLHYGGDKTTAGLGATALWHESDCGDVSLPSPLDDEFVTEDGYLEQPNDHTPVLAGFYYISKLFRLLGQILEKRKADRHKPPAGLMLQLRINEIQQLHSQVVGLMDNCPAALKLDMSGSPRAKMDQVDGQWDQTLSADIRQLLFEPSTANREVVKDHFLVQQANIYVTQQMVRYIILQYQEELGQLQDKEQAREDEREPPGAPERRLAAYRRLERISITEAEKDQISSDLLYILSAIRMEVIAVNSFALVSKVRFVASTLLDALQTPPPTGTDQDSIKVNESIARAQGYLWDFLRILSDIEALHLVDVEDD